MKFSFSVGTIESLDNEADSLQEIVQKAADWAFFAHYQGEDGEIKIWENGGCVGVMRQTGPSKWNLAK